nr:DMT family transporter [Actinopolymorpha rutila]
MSIALALLVAVTNATSNVLMRKAARVVPTASQFQLSLVLRLVRSPVWLVGLTLSLATYPLGAAALGFGKLSVVQPILVLELPLSLIGASWLYDSRLSRRDWLGISMMTVGLIGLLVVLVPEGGQVTGIPASTWLVGSGLNIGVVIVLYMLGRRTTQPSGRAAYLGAGCGLAFGLSAVYMKSMTEVYDTEGIPGVLTSWEFYGSVATATLAFWLLQNAYAAGQLAASQPGVTLLDPAVAILWGLIVFQEKTEGGLFLLLAVAASAGIVAGALTLAKSPQLRRMHENPAEVSP